METVSRKHLLAQAATLMGGATVLNGVDRAQAAPAELPVYRLDNLGGAHNAGCASCNACTAHAEHKYFASAADADLDRAHPYCKCRVIQGRDLPYAEWVALFGVPGSSPAEVSMTAPRGSPRYSTRRPRRPAPNTTHPCTCASCGRVYRGA